MFEESQDLSLSQHSLLCKSHLHSTYMCMVQHLLYSALCFFLAKILAPLILLTLFLYSYIISHTPRWEFSDCAAPGGHRGAEGSAGNVTVCPGQGSHANQTATLFAWLVLPGFCCKSYHSPVFLCLVSSYFTSPLLLLPRRLEDWFSLLVNHCSIFSTVPVLCYARLPNAL